LNDREGHIWIPTMGGMAIIDPARIFIDRIPSPVYIEKLIADGIPQSFSNQPVPLPAGTSRFEFYFTTLDFLNFSNVYFRYRLEGFERQWNEIGGRDSWRAPYMNLPPGNYTFQVKARNSNGIWNETGASLSIFISPKFWQTTWFKILSFMIFTLFSYLLISFIRRYYHLLFFWKRRRMLGHYILEDIIGYGGTSTVFRAHPLLRPSQKVALKILKKEHMDNPLSVKRFRQEASIIDMLEHQHIVKVLERGSSDDNIFIVMELLEGETLQKKLQKEKQPSFPDIAGIILQTAMVLHDLHTRAIVHRDLKPANIMLLSKNGVQNYVKLMDFGSVKISYHPRITLEEKIIGTLYYMAPERISLSSHTSAGDIYSLGIIGYEMVTGHLPFSDRGYHDLMQSIIRDPLPPITDFRPETPSELTDLITRMIDKDPEKRPTARSVYDTLSEILL
ncbi:MAG: hypothetical protein EH225_10870, partial [Calditrichaeota bacterium]